jgi:low temperature requirement protein LtrA
VGETIGRAVHQRVGWFELFYDLVIVAAVGHGSHLFGAYPTWGTGAWIAIAILVMFVLWLLTALNNNLYPGDHPWRRILVLVQMLAVVVAALSMGREQGLPDSDGFIALAIAFGSISGTYVLAARAHSAERGDAMAIAISTGVGAAVLLLGAWVTQEGQASTNPAPWILGVGLAICIVPLVTSFLGRLCSTGRIDDEHLGERVGQLVIIVLGESFVSLVASLSDRDSIPNMLFFVLTFVVVFAIWTMYFSSVVPAGVPKQAGSLRAWLMGHWVLMFGAVGAAAGFSALAVVPFDAADQGTASAWTTAPLLWVVLSLALLTWLGRRRVTGLVWIHVCAAGGLVVLLVLGATLTSGGTGWEVAVGGAVVVIDALACARIERPYGRASRNG